VRYLLATTNQGKLRELQQILADLDIVLETLDAFPALPEVLEDGSTFAENARLKAIHYSTLTGLPTIADDSGLQVDALGGGPGVRSARFAPSDRERVAKLLGLMAHLDPEKELGRRTARFVCAVCLAELDGELFEATSSVEGLIIGSARGSRGFGYDPVFLYPAMGKTFAELTSEEKNRVSHRGQALRKLRRYLESRF
jgi:XTP/dITP diphosphohydrolase